MTATRPMGRLPQRAAVERLPLRWAHEYLASPLSPVAYPVDVSEGVADFGVMGNDLWGNCVPAGDVHLEMTTAVAAGVAGPAPSDESAVLRYQQYTGAQQPPGPGCVIADYLLWLYQQGAIVAFAPVDVSDLAQSDAFMAAGFGLLRGVSLTSSDQARFDLGQAWTVNAGEQPDPALGHCVLTVGATGVTDGDIEWDVTWGRRQPATRGWSKVCTDEAWLVVTNEEQAARFTPQLLADVAALGGTGGEQLSPPHPAPPPDPAPVPAPVPPDPAPTPAPAPPVPQPDWWQELEMWLLEELLPFLENLAGSGRGMAAGYLAGRGRNILARRHDELAQGTG